MEEHERKRTREAQRRKHRRKPRMFEPQDWGALAEAAFFPAPSMDDIRRERAKARELRSSQWWKRKRASGICHYCGRKFPPAELTMDHLVPLARGGRSTKGNLVPACKECNTRKKYLLAFEFDPNSTPED
jgi:5-methylcytosine-specific restriction protein A